MNDDIQATGQQQVTPAFSSSLASPPPAPALYSDAGDDYATEQQQANEELMPEQPVSTDDIAALSQSVSDIQNGVADQPAEAAPAQDQSFSDQSQQDAVIDQQQPSSQDQPVAGEGTGVMPPQNSQANNNVISASAMVAESKNILITVSKNPSIDELSAAIGLTLALDKMDKKATAIYSGRTPHAISFLEPDSTFQDDVSSLRDFIISLDKAKADRLRYKVDNDSGMVKIFVTPYRVKITSDDLNFSEGDYNVDTVVALGIKSRDDFDSAILSHGRILHDAKIVTINTGEGVSALGSVNWDDPKASSISEMLVSLIDNLAAGLLDNQIATSLMTGIVAATDRFSNLKTSPEVMQVASRLMSSGANQQLISSNVASTTTPEVINEAKPKDDELVLEHKNGETPQASKNKKRNRNRQNNKQRQEQNVVAQDNIQEQKASVPEPTEEYPVVTQLQPEPQMQPQVQQIEDQVSAAREAVNNAEELSGGFPKEAVGLQGSLDVAPEEGLSLNNNIDLDSVDTSAQMKQSENIRNDLVLPDMPPEEPAIQNINVDKSTTSQVGDSNDLSLPPLPPIPPSLDDMGGLPPIQGLEPDFMSSQTSKSSFLTQGADDLFAEKNAKAQENEARQAKFDSLYGEDPNKIAAV
jgi:nanoRNase/pAp phosphatase (c-di-AMP/oligoRNAs hydrolase)